MATLPWLIAEMRGPGPPQPLLHFASPQERVTKVTQIVPLLGNMLHCVEHIAHQHRFFSSEQP